MKSVFALALLAALSSVNALTVNTPSAAVQCEPLQLTWTDGTAPYFLSLIPGGQVSAAAIKQFPTQEGNSFTWNVDLASGTSFTVSLKDSTGTQAFSDAVTIQSSSDSSCINTSVVESGASTGSVAQTSGSAASTTAGTGSSAVSTPAAQTSGTGTLSRSSSGSSSSSATRSSSASTVSQSSAALRGSSVGAAGIAAAFGLVGAALL